MHQNAWNVLYTIFKSKSKIVLCTKYILKDVTLNMSCRICHAKYIRQHVSCKMCHAESIMHIVSCKICQALCVVYNTRIHIIY